MLDILENCNELQKKEILHKVFYLGGYIVEFSYKFAFFEAFKLKQELNESDDINTFLDDSFRKKWRIHNFDNLNTLCSNNGVTFNQDIPYFGNKQNVIFNKLVKSWDVQIRYSLAMSRQYIDLNEGNIRMFVETLEKIVSHFHSRK
ncbi:hypothetical protein ABID42_003970 [Arcicella rosea]|uniref:hypothetical protein n=1 Tax=Arcicella rosea TaxID=502909 RepID=UPI00345C75FF